MCFLLYIWVGYCVLITRLHLNTCGDSCILRCNASKLSIVKMKLLCTDASWNAFSGLLNLVSCESSECFCPIRLQLLCCLQISKLSCAVNHRASIKCAPEQDSSRHLRNIAGNWSGEKNVIFLSFLNADQGSSTDPRNPAPPVPGARRRTWSFESPMLIALSLGRSIVFIHPFLLFYCRLSLHVLVFWWSVVAHEEVEKESRPVPARSEWKWTPLVPSGAALASS